MQNLLTVAEFQINYSISIFKWELARSKLMRLKLRMHKFVEFLFLHDDASHKIYENSHRSKFLTIRQLTITDLGYCATEAQADVHVQYVHVHVQHSFQIICHLKIMLHTLEIAEKILKQHHFSVFLKLCRNLGQEGKAHLLRQGENNW